MALNKRTAIAMVAEMHTEDDKALREASVRPMHNFSKLPYNLTSFTYGSYIFAYDKENNVIFVNLQLPEGFKEK